MPTSPMNEVIQYLRSTLLPEGADLTDGQLLECFVSRREPAALEALVRRHGPMVWGVCRRILQDHHDAEDAFQATFLVLVRKAASIRSPAQVGCWLYGVAHQTALKARATRAKRQVRERPVNEMPEPAVTDQDLWSDLQPLLDQEVSRLPEKYRTVIVLCELEGKTVREAARQLGCPDGTVASRLARARTMLAKRLARHGVPVSSGTLAGVLSQKAALASVPGSAMSSAIQAVTSVAAGKAVAGVVSGTVAAVTEGVMKAMFLSKVKGVLVVLVLLAAVTGVATIALLAQGGKTAEQRLLAPERPRAQKPAPAAKAPVDLFGDPLPQGAMARLGTIRLKPGQNIDFVGFLPGGKTLVSPGWESIRFWDVATGQELRRIATPRSASSLALSPDGQTLAATCYQTVRLWNTATGKELLHFQGSGSLAFAHDGRKILSGDGRTLHLWETASGKKLGTLRVPPSGLWREPFVFSADDRAVITAREHEILFTNLSSGKRERRIQLGEAGLGEHAFSADGRLLAGRSKNAIHIFDLLKGQETRRLDDRGSANPFGFSPDNKLLLTAGDALGLWDLAAGKQIRRLPSTGIPVAAAFSPNGKLLAQGNSWRSGLHLWDVETGKEVLRQPGHTGNVGSVVFSPDGKTVVSRSHEEKMLRFWDSGTGKELRLISSDVGDRRADAGYGHAIAYSPDGRSIALGDLGGIVYIWDTKTGKVVRKLLIDNLCRQINAVSFSRDGRTVAVSSSITRYDKSSMPGCVTVFDLAHGKTLLQQPLPCAAHAGVVQQASVFSPDHRFLAIAGDDNRLWLWDLSRNCAAFIREHQSHVFHLAFSPDGRFIATISRADDQWYARLWEVASGKEALRLRTEGHVVCFSADGLLATGAAEAIRVWSLATAQEIAHFQGHRVPVLCLAFSPDGKRLATGQTDSTVLVWDVAKAARQRRIPAKVLKAEALERLWAQLAGADAAKAYAAVRTLSGVPEQALPYLREHLQPARALDVRRIGKLLDELNSPRYAVRAAASKQLEQLGTQVEPALRHALEGRPSPEARRRIQALLSKLTDRRRTVIVDDPVVLRGIRAIQVLEYTGSPEARRLLKQLAQGAPEARLTQEAHRSLDRLPRRGAR